MSGVSEGQPALDMVITENKCRCIFPTLTKGLIEPSHEVRLIPGVNVLPHQPVEGLRHLVHPSSVPTYICQGYAGEEVIVANGKIVQVASALFLVDGDAGYPAEQAGELRVHRAGPRLRRNGTGVTRRFRMQVGGP